MSRMPLMLDGQGSGRLQSREGSREPFSLQTATPELCSLLLLELRRAAPFGPSPAWRPPVLASRSP